MKRYLLRALTAWLLVFLALYAALFSVTDTFDLWVNATWLLLGAVLFSGAPALLLTIPHDAARCTGVLALLSVLGLWLQLRFDRLVIGGQVLFHQISFRYSEIVPKLFYYGLPEELAEQSHAALALPATEAAGWLTLLLAVALTVCLVLFRTSWPLVCAAALFPALGLVVLLEPPLLPALALLLLAGLTLFGGRAMRRSPHVACRRVWAALVPMALVLAVLASLVPPSRYVRAPQAEVWRAKAMNWSAGMGLTLGSSPQAGLPGGSYRAVADGTQNVTNAGPLRFTGRVDLTVTGLPAGDHLLRGASSAVYGPDGWGPLDDDAYQALELSQEQWPLTFPAQAYAHARSPADLRTVTVTLGEEAAGYLYLPYHLVTAPSDMPGVVTWQDAYLTPQDLSAGYTASVDLMAAPTEDAQLSRMPPEEATYWELEYREWVREHYLQLPLHRLSDEAREVVYALVGDGTYVPWNDARTLRTELGLQGLDDRDPVAVALAVKAYLESFTSYDQDTPQAPQGEDFVNYFLTESHRGYCLHYASAATLMIRAFGIPARFVTGYAVEVPEGTTTLEVRDYAAHAWVEVYVDGYGWEPVDVTPTNSQTVAQASASPSPTPTPTPSQTAAPTPTPTPTPSGRPQATGAFDWAPVLRVARWVLLAVAALVILWLQSFLRRRRWRAQLGQPDHNRAARAAYRYLDALARRAGVPIPPRAVELAQKAAFSQHTLTDRERRELKDLVRETQKAARDQNGGLRRLGLRVIWALL